MEERGEIGNFQQHIIKLNCTTRADTSSEVAATEYSYLLTENDALSFSMLDNEKTYISLSHYKSREWVHGSLIFWTAFIIFDINLTPYLLLVHHCHIKQEAKRVILSCDITLRAD